MNNIILFFISCCFLTQQEVMVSATYYLPGVVPRTYEEYENVRMKNNKNIM